MCKGVVPNLVRAHVLPFPCSRFGCVSQVLSELRQSKGCANSMASLPLRSYTAPLSPLPLQQQRTKASGATHGPTHACAALWVHPRLPHFPDLAKFRSCPSHVAFWPGRCSSSPPSVWKAPGCRKTTRSEPTYMENPEFLCFLRKSSRRHPYNERQQQIRKPAGLREGPARIARVESVGCLSRAEERASSSHRCH